MIYHIAELDVWGEQSEERDYVPRRFANDGFVHCSEVQQLEPVADYNFKDRTDLLLLEIDPTRLETNTRYENLEVESERYPHVYGPISKRAVTRVIRIACNTDGSFEGVFDQL